MQKKRFSSEQIIAKLRQIEVQLAQGKSIALACKDVAVSEQSYFRWRKEYGGVPIEQAKRLKDLERENARVDLWCSFTFSGFNKHRHEKRTCRGRHVTPRSSSWAMIVRRS
jgi:hypothetical protein